MIRNPNEIQEGAKKIRMLIAGYPGIGKSTLALSAPRPLHIDVDFGIDRIEPRYRKPYIQPKSYDEILEDLTPINVQDFDTLVFDTGGKLISLMSQWAIKKDVKYGQRDGSLSLKGYGFIGREFQRLMDYCFYELDKHIVVVFHAIEEKDGDNTRLRIKVEGQTKNNVWEPMDLGGFVEIQGNNRTIGFSNCERYFAKGTRGIHGVWQVAGAGAGQAQRLLDPALCPVQTRSPPRKWLRTRKSRKPTRRLWPRGKRSSLVSPMPTAPTPPCPKSRPSTTP